MQLILYPTNRCNLNCRQCPVNKMIDNDLSMIEIEKVASWDVTKIGILGGEPYMRDDLEDIVEAFGNRPVTIYTNGLLVEEENVIPDVNYCISIDGGRKNHNYWRGEGTWQKAINTLEMLSTKQENNIRSLWIRMTYTNDNWRDIGTLYKKAKELGNVNLLLHPNVGEHNDPLDEEIQLELFKMAAEEKDIEMVILQPHFWHFCGYKESTCPAGIHRIAVDENGRVKPCQWLNHTIGDIHNTTYQQVLKRGRNYHKKHAHSIKDSCMMCPDRDKCRSSCKMTREHETCPLRNQMKASTFYSGAELETIQTKHRSMSNVGLVGC